VKGTALLIFITLQRAAELALASRNTRSLRRRGAYEVGAAHYPAMVALHASWLATLWLFGRRRPVVAPFLALFAALGVARVWVLATLRGRWTTRIVLLPGTTPIVSGPYRFVRHPNYLIVALELPCVALALGLVRHAAVFGTANLAMLAWRIRCEDDAFSASERGGEPSAPAGERKNGC
jgi:methyltransferase